VTHSDRRSDNIGQKLIHSDQRSERCVEIDKFRPPISVSVSNYELDKQKLLLLISHNHVFVQTFLNDSTESAAMTFSGSWFHASITTWLKNFCMQVVLIGCLKIFLLCLRRWAVSARVKNWSRFTFSLFVIILYVSMRVRGVFDIPESIESILGAWPAYLNV